MKKISFILITFFCLNIFASEDIQYRVLFISDSHGLGDYGKVMDELLRTKKNSYIHTYSIGGTAPWQWINPYSRWVSSRGYVDSGSSNSTPLPRNKENIKKTKTPMFKELLTSMNNLSGKKYIVISLGTNHNHDDWGLNFLKNNVKKMTMLVQEFDYKCFWIGPPQMRRWDQRGSQYYQDTLKAIIMGIEDRCLFFDSTAVTRYPPGGDGIHFSRRIYEHIEYATTWATEAFIRLYK